MEKKLYKSNKNKMLDGVCGGIGEYFNVDPTLVRLVFALLCIFAGGGILLYIIALIVIPRAPEGYDPQAAQQPTSSTAAPNGGTATPNGNTANTNGTATEQAPPSDNDTPTMI